MREDSTTDDISNRCKGCCTLSLAKTQIVPLGQRRALSNPSNPPSLDSVLRNILNHTSLVLVPRPPRRPELHHPQADQYTCKIMLEELAKTKAARTKRIRVTAPTEYLR